MSQVSSRLESLRRIADRRRIAVVPIRGAIGGRAKPADVIRVLGEARRNDRIRAVLLDIDSPGGGATSSEAIYFAVRRLAQEKPVVAWFSGTGASGAYLVACGATRILTFPSAIVGSIGVISIRPLAVELIRRIGARIQVTKTGPFKDLGAPWREPNDADRAKEQTLVDAIFARFTGAVRTARGLDDAALARVTTGEVWLGMQALDLGLVDGIAEDEDAALREIAQMAALPHHQVLRLSPRRTVLQRLGVPAAGMGPPSSRWLMEIEGWMRTPSLRL
ncbi:MAG: signal peptide peptidase SppA [Actinobacteria bacterium]|nr:signal peptide peptidase SppA [Actinomycetota bacterium]